MFRKYIFAALAAFICAPTSGLAQQAFNDSQIEAFLQAAGVTPKYLGMKWYRECRLEGVAKNSTGADRKSEWEIASLARYQQLMQSAERRDKEQPTYKWSVPCRAQLYFPDAADPAAALSITPVQYRVAKDGPVLTMSEGNALRYNACQPVKVLGHKHLKKPGCK